MTATVRTEAKADQYRAKGYAMHVFAGTGVDPAVVDALQGADVLLISAPPEDSGDPVLNVYGDAIAQAPRPRWIGYLSTVGVYGDHAGAWVDETTPPQPRGRRSLRRLDAERQWASFGEMNGKPTHLFRLAGIYGPGRNQLLQVADGSARRIVKAGQVFNRIHVADIAQVVEASLARPRGGAIYNVADDEPAPPQDVVAYAAALCGRAPPPEIPFETAELSAMSRSFFDEVKRVRNRLLKDELGVVLQYPTYREGLTALRAAGEGA